MGQPPGANMLMVSRSHDVSLTLWISLSNRITEIEVAEGLLCNKMVQTLQHQTLPPYICESAWFSWISYTIILFEFHESTFDLHMDFRQFFHETLSRFPWISTCKFSVDEEFMKIKSACILYLALNFVVKLSADGLFRHAHAPLADFWFKQNALRFMSQRDL